MACNVCCRVADGPLYHQPRYFCKRSTTPTGRSEDKTPNPHPEPSTKSTSSLHSRCSGFTLSTPDLITGNLISEISRENATLLHHHNSLLCASPLRIALAEAVPNCRLMVCLSRLTTRSILTGLYCYHLPVKLGKRKPGSRFVHKGTLSQAACYSLRGCCTPP